jgi:hypothetical protein
MVTNLFERLELRSNKTRSPILTGRVVGDEGKARWGKKSI